jgi:hypothetical protein
MMVVVVVVVVEGEEEGEEVVVVSVGRLVQHSRLTSENVLSFPFLREPVPFPLLEPERARAAATAGLTALAPLTVRRRIPGLALAWWAGGCTTRDKHADQQHAHGLPYTRLEPWFNGPSQRFTARCYVWPHASCTPNVRHGGRTSLATSGT